jgi:N-acetylmuramoyl-L-alanine amidase CwlA
MAAQLVQFNPEDAQFESLIKHLGPVLFRELTGKSSKAAEQLMQMATEVASILRDKIGETEFNALLSNYQMESAKKQAERKRERKELLLVDQQAAAKERQRLTVRKSSAKKRKLDAANPYRVLKRKRRDEIRRTGEIE